MTVHHGLHIRTVLHDRQMQQHLAGPLPLAGDLVAFHVHRTDVVRLHEALADHGRGAEHFIFAHPNADVAIIRSGKALVVDPATNLADLFLQCPVIDSAVPFRSHLSTCFLMKGSTLTASRMAAL